MKLVMAALLIFGVLTNSISAIAEEPIPFAALMHSEAAEPSVPPMDDQSTAMPSQTAHPHHLTGGGKAMIGTGIGLCVVGAFVMAGTVALGSWASSAHAELYGASGGLLVGGTALIVIGSHRRSTR